MEQRKPNFEPHVLKPRDTPPASGGPEPPVPVPVPAAAAAAAERPSASGEAMPNRLEPSAAAARRRMSVQGQVRTRRPPSEREQSRRRMLLLWTKWLLPVFALLLLGSIATWPEINRSLNAGKAAYRQVAGVNLDSGKMLGARYRGMDAHSRPYMITADEARQTGPDHIDLTHPVADTISENGAWIQIQARNGVYMPHTQILDLFDHVTLYRDDGTLMNGPTAVMDVKRGVVVSNDWVHAEGPFGVLDAQGEMMSQKEGIVQFRGPARMILNDDHTPPPAGPGPGPTPAKQPDSQGTAR